MKGIPFVFKNKTKDQIKMAQLQGMMTFTQFHKALGEMKIEYEKMISTSCEEELRSLYKLGYQKELGWCLDVIESLKRLDQCWEIETKRIGQILKTAKKKHNI